jgi:hypothetical protein
MVKSKDFVKDFKYWSWWEKLSPKEQEQIIKTVYQMQEQNIWEEVEED